MLKVWSLRLHIYSAFEEDIPILTAAGESRHKEEIKVRITSDASDRQSLRNALNNYIDPLQFPLHPTELVNVVTRYVTPYKSIFL